MNAMRGLGEKVENTTLVKKILRPLQMIFDSKVSSLEERKYLDKLSMDELHGILTTYEMRKKQEKPSRKEATFKVSRRQRRSTKSQNHALVVVKTQMMKKKPTL